MKKVIFKIEFEALVTNNQCDALLKLDDNDYEEICNEFKKSKKWKNERIKNAKIISILEKN